MWHETARTLRVWEGVTTALAKVKGSRMVVLGTAGDPSHFSYGIRNQDTRSRVVGVIGDERDSDLGSKPWALLGSDSREWFIVEDDDDGTAASATNDGVQRCECCGNEYPYPGLLDTHRVWCWCDEDHT